MRLLQPVRRAADRQTPKPARTAASWPTTAAPTSGRKTPSTPRDQDGTITDVYEYVDGRPQLITTGQGNRDFTGGSEVFSLLASAAYTGLEAVSHNGVDVYFSTFDTLVKRDHNGEFIKFYDARTGGGFPEEPELLPCEAADECHGRRQLAAGAAGDQQRRRTRRFRKHPGHRPEEGQGEEEARRRASGSTIARRSDTKRQAMNARSNG